VWPGPGRFRMGPHRPLEQGFLLLEQCSVIVRKTKKPVNGRSFRALELRHGLAAPAFNRGAGGAEALSLAAHPRPVDCVLASTSAAPAVTPPCPQRGLVSACCLPTRSLGDVGPTIHGGKNKDRPGFGRDAYPHRQRAQCVFPVHAAVNHRGLRCDGVRRILLTSSCGPFLQRRRRNGRSA